MRLYTYVIQYDDGHAPNYDPPFVTLATCKPDIRRCSREGDAVLAFTGSRLSREPHAVCWAGVIRRKLTFAEYWDDSKFQAKKLDRSQTPDNIYEPVGAEFRQVSGGYHGTDDDRWTDLRGRCVLVLDPSWRFGVAGPILPDEFGLRMRGARRKHRVHDLTDSEWAKLRMWLDQQQRGSFLGRGSGRCRPSRVRTPRRVACGSRFA